MDTEETKEDHTFTSLLNHPFSTPETKKSCLLILLNLITTRGVREGNAFSPVHLSVCLSVCLSVYGGVPIWPLHTCSNLFTWERLFPTPQPQPNPNPTQPNPTPTLDLFIHVHWGLVHLLASGQLAFDLKGILVLLLFLNDTWLFLTFEI